MLGIKLGSVVYKANASFTELWLSTHNGIIFGSQGSYVTVLRLTPDYIQGSLLLMFGGP